MRNICRNLILIFFLGFIFFNFGSVTADAFSLLQTTAVSQSTYLALLFGGGNVTAQSTYFALLFGDGTVTAQSATVTSTRSGNWSDASVWSTNAIPTAGSVAAIAAGHTITYDVSNDAILGSMSINGTLRFARATNTRLKMGGNIVVFPGGYLDMGTVASPVLARAELTFVLTPAQAGAYVGSTDSMVHDAPSALATSDIGLWVFGRWDSHGKPLTRTWSKLAVNAAPGTILLTFANDVSKSWKVGSKIIVTSTRNPARYAYSPTGYESRQFFPEHEVRTITAIEPLWGGRTRIAVNAPLTYAHNGTAPFQGEVALLTRNVIVSTEIVGATDFTDVRTRKFAHTAYQYGASGDLAYTEFYRLGHYGINGRYAIHYHRMLGTSAGMIARGNAMWNTGFRCLNLHISDGVLVEDNVCYDSSSTAFFTEQDEIVGIPGYARGYNEDNVFVHNIVIDTKSKHFLDRLDRTIFGEDLRAAAFWVGAQTQHEAYLGNVVAGVAGIGYESGFHFPEHGNAIASAGTIPFTFVSNEVHGSHSHGIFAWQNTTVSRDAVDTRLWRNTDSGFRWGAYVMPIKFFGAKILENGKSGLETSSIDIFLQDSLVTGSTVDASRNDYGVFVNGYIAPQYPAQPTWIVRNQFTNLPTAGISQVQRVLINDNVSGTECSTHDFGLNMPYDLKLRPVLGGECSGVYLLIAKNKFTNVPITLDYGDALNPNSWWKVFDHAGTQDDFVLVRRDQITLTRQSVLAAKLVTDTAFYDAGPDALRIPMASLPVAGIPYTGLFNHRTQADQGRALSPDFTFGTQIDYPPTIAMTANFSGTVVTLIAIASDDKAVTRVEFLVDWTVYVDNTAPYTVTVNLAGSGRRYAYLYARAFDGVRQLGTYEQRAYSNVVEVGPEVLVGP